MLCAAAMAMEVGKFRLSSTSGVQPAGYSNPNASLGKCGISKLNASHLPMSMVSFRMITSYVFHNTVSVVQRGNSSGRKSGKFWRRKFSTSLKLWTSTSTPLKCPITLNRILFSTRPFQMSSRISLGYGSWMSYFVLCGDHFVFFFWSDFTPYHWTPTDISQRANAKIPQGYAGVIKSAVNEICLTIESHFSDKCNLIYSFHCCVDVRDHGGVMFV